MAHKPAVSTDELKRQLEEVSGAMISTVQIQGALKVILRDLIDQRENPRPVEGGKF